MVTTTSPSFRAAVLLIAILAPSCPAYHLQSSQQRAAFFANQNRNRKTPMTTMLSVGADFDNDIEAALGQGSVSEYERDAEFYKKRNEAYFKSLHKVGEGEDAAAAAILSAAPDAASGHKTSGGGEPDHQTPSQKHENPRWVTDSITASQNSFKFVEKSTFSMLKQKPMVALAIFATTGMLVAYLSGFFFLEGYIENWNPVENDMIPYWDDAEIHTIDRALPSSEE